MNSHGLCSRNFIFDFEKLCAHWEYISIFIDLFVVAQIFHEGLESTGNGCGERNLLIKSLKQ